MELHESILVSKHFKQFIPSVELEELLRAKNVSADEIKQLIHLKQQVVKFGDTIDYILEPSKHGWGRLVSKNSIFNLSRPVRHYLCRNSYVDIDIQNAQPTILMSYCKKFGIQCSELTYYVENRNQIFKQLEDELKINQEDISRIGKLYPEYQCYNKKDLLKKIPLLVMNGGNIDSFYQKIGKKPSKELQDYFNNLSKNISQIFENLKLRETTLYKFCEKYVKSKKSEFENIKGSFMSFFYQTLELRIIEAVVKHIGIENEHIFIYELDGFKIPKNDEYDIDLLLAECHKAIVSEFGEDFSNVKFVVKEMDEPIVLEKMTDTELEFIDAMDKLQENYDCDQICSQIFYDNHKDSYLHNASVGWMKVDNKTNLWKEVKSIFDDISIYFTELITMFIDRIEEKQQKVVKRHLTSARFSKNIGIFLEEKFSKDNSFMKIFESKKNYFVFSDGMYYNLDTKEVGQIEKNDYVVNHCGYPYKNLKEIDETKAKDFIYSIQRTEEQAQVLLSFLSSSLYGENRNNGFIVFTGTGGNGKSILDNLMRHTLGDYYKTIPVSEITSYDKEKGRANAEIFKCKYARYVSCSEPENSKMESLKVSTIKKLTGNETISVRTLNKEPIEFVPHFTLFLSCNDIPKISNSDQGISRRLKIVSFPFSFVDPSVYDENDSLQKIGSLTLSKEIEEDAFKYGMIKLLIQNYQINKGRYMSNESVSETTKAYLAENSPIKKWFDSYCEISDDSRIVIKEIYEHYKNHTNEPILEDKFSKELVKFARRQASNSKNYYWIRFKTEQPSGTSKEECQINEKDI